jgi:microcin C transport system substrate-binding protein
MKAEATGPRTVKFTFSNPDNHELPLIIGQLPVLSKTFFTTQPFEQTTLQPVLGSGPYKISNVEAGRSVTYERVRGWWGENLPIFKGRYNFNTQRDDYYRDYQVAFEAFGAGKIDFRLENKAQSWAQGYDSIPAYKKGDIIKRLVPLQAPALPQGFILNSRRDVFESRTVRHALSLTYDFEWANKNLAFGLYKRIRSYFDKSELAATGVPAGAELALLEPFRADLPPELFTQEFQPSVTDGSGNNRKNMQRAMELLQQAGWKLENNALVKNGKPLTFEILLTEGDTALERWIQPWLRNLERMGIKASIRMVDSAQYINRLNEFNFDVVVKSFPQSLSPGNEQRDYWHSSKANVNGGKNLMGVRSPVVDAMVEKIIGARSRAELVTATRALDRVLQWGYYMVPNWYSPAERLAYWNKFGTPATNPPYGLAIDTWWQKWQKAP